MRCEELEKLFPDYLNGDISASQKQLMDEHLSHCARCRSTLAAYEEARQHLSFLKDAPIPSDFAKATMAKVKAATTKSRSRQWLRPALGAATAVIVLAILLVTQPWGVNPQSVMAKAYAATSNLQSYRMTSTLVSIFEGETSEQSSEWEFVFPDRYHGRITLDSETYEFIIIGDKQYVRAPDNTSGKLSIGVWSAFTPSKEYTLEILDSLTGLQKLPDEKIEGTDCLHYRGKADVEGEIEKQKARLDPEEPGYEERLRGLDALRTIETEVELWIGKDDFLIRQMKSIMESLVHGNAVVLVKFYDLNEPIEIEPPEAASGELLPGWHLAGSHSTETYFHAEIDSEITGEDPAHQQISLSVTITNVGVEAASNVQVSLHNAATIRDKDEESWINAEPSIPGPVNLEPGESETYSASWEYDASRIAKDKITELVKPTRVRIIYTTPDGNEAVRLYSEGAPYPSKVPPERPPG